MLREGNLPYYFVPSINLLSIIPADIIEKVTDKVSELIESFILDSFSCESKTPWYLDETVHKRILSFVYWEKKNNQFLRSFILFILDYSSFNEN